MINLHLIDTTLTALTTESKNNNDESNSNNSNNNSLSESVFVLAAMIGSILFGMVCLCVITYVLVSCWKQKRKEALEKEIRLNAQGVNITNRLDTPRSVVSMTGSTQMGFTTNVCQMTINVLSLLTTQSTVH